MTVDKTQDHSVAVTTAINSYALTTSIDRGTITEGTNYEYDADATIDVEFTPATGYHVVGISVDGDALTGEELTNAITAGKVAVDRTQNHSVAVTTIQTSTAFDIEKRVVQVGDATVSYTDDEGAAESIPAAKVGDTITWKITLANNGNIAQTFTLSDTLTNGVSADVKIVDEAGKEIKADETVTLAAGTSAVYTATYKVVLDDAGERLTNTVVAENQKEDTKTGESQPVPVDPALKVEKTVNKATATVGDTLTYTITVTNNSSEELKNITVVDAMLGLNEEIKTLAVAPAEGSTVTFSKTYTVTANNVGTLTNTVVVTDESDNEYKDSVDTTVNKKPSKPSTDIPDKVPLETEDHYAYIIGYPDGNVKPAGNITRAEVATIFFRLLTDEARDLFWSTTNEYSDVAADQWFNNAISTLSNAGIINGYEDGSFRPNNPITRAEFSKIAVSFFSYVDEEYQGLFPDVPADKWYALYVEAAKELGLINGYEDGTFRPEQNITRAEACTIVNNTIQRNPHEDQLHEDMIVWPDNPAPGEVGHMWYYEEIQEATNSHDYTFANDYEDWTEILENRDWAALEKAWADSNDAPGGDVMK